MNILNTNIPGLLWLLYIIIFFSKQICCKIGKTIAINYAEININHNTELDEHLCQFVFFSFIINIIPAYLVVIVKLRINQSNLFKI